MTITPIAPSALPMSAVAADDVVRVDATATLAEIAGVMVTQSVGAVVVGTPDSPFGVVSERDVVRAVADGADPSTTAADLAP